MKRIDPIDLLREYTLKNKTVKLKEGNLIFGSSKLPFSVPTCWRPKKGQERGNKRYNLGSLWLFLKFNADGSGQKKDYFVEFKKLSTDSKLGEVQYISAPHRDEIIKYFSGQIDNTEQIDETLRESVKTQNLRKRGKIEVMVGGGFFMRD